MSRQAATAHQREWFCCASPTGGLGYGPRPDSYTWPVGVVVTTATGGPLPSPPAEARHPPSDLGDVHAVNEPAVVESIEHVYVTLGSLSSNVKLTAPVLVDGGPLVMNDPQPECRLPTTRSWQRSCWLPRPPPEPRTCGSHA